MCGDGKLFIGLTEVATFLPVLCDFHCSIPCIGLVMDLLLE